MYDKPALFSRDQSTSEQETVYRMPNETRPDIKAPDQEGLDPLLKPVVLRIRARDRAELE